MRSLEAFREQLENHSSDKEKTVLLDYPIVYIHNWKSGEEYEIYIGESNDVVKRTKQHYDKARDKGLSLIHIFMLFS